MQSILKKIYSKIFQYRKQIIIGSLLGSSIIIFYKMSKKPRQPPKKMKKMTSQSSSNSLLELEQDVSNQAANEQKLLENQYYISDDDNKLDEVAQSFSISYFDKKTHTLDMKTISKILEYSVDIAEEDFIRITQKNRQKRRAILKLQGVSQEYQENIIDYNERIENLLSRAQENILCKISIQKEVFEESILEMTERGLYQQIYMLQAAIRQKIKDKLESKQPLNIKRTKEILKYQITLLKDQPGLFSGVISKTEPQLQQMIPILVNTIVHDMIYKKYQIEEEDYIKNIYQYMKEDKEVESLVDKLQKQLVELIEKHGMGMGGPIGDQMAGLSQNPV